MRIRTTLYLALSGMAVVALASMGAAYAWLQKGHVSNLLAQREQFIVSLVERTAAEAVTANDRVFLVSQLKFLRNNYPAVLAYRVLWEDGQSRQEIAVGEPPGPDVRTLERRVSAHGDPKPSVAVDVFLDDRALREQILGPGRQFTRGVLVAFAFLMLLSLVSAVYLSRSFTRPVEALASASQRLAAGDVGFKLPNPWKGELGLLIDSFNEMSSQLGELDRMKQDLLSSVTHELKSPLSALETVFNTISHRLGSHGKVDTAYLEESILHTRKQTQRLMSLIDNLLDSAKIAKGGFACKLVPVDMQRLLSEVAFLWKPKTEERGLRLVLALGEGCPQAMGDPDRLHQVFANLINNAIKFTPSGGEIRVTVSPNGRGAIDVSIADTGAGIDAADIPRLFGKFQQGRNVAKRTPGSPGGTGLGLFIVKTIVEQHGSGIAVQSAPGAGTTFRFALRPAS